LSFAAACGGETLIFSVFPEGVTLKTAKKILCLLLTAVLVLSLCACGEDPSVYTIIDTVGEKRYGTIFRLDDRVAEQVSAAMSVLAASGELSVLSTQWLGQDAICLAGSADAITALPEPPQPRTLIVGVENEAMPLSYTRDGEYTGMSVDIAVAIGRVLGWEIRLQPISSQDIAAQLSSGNIDCALGFGLDSVSAEAYTLGECYMTSEIVLMTKTEYDVHRIKDLEGEKIGAVKDAAVIAALEANEKVVKYVESVTAYLSPTRCMNALDKGWCAAVAMDRIMIKAYISA